MSDPYLVYDKSNIQVNVFHVKERPKGTIAEMKHELHKECYVFSDSNTDTKCKRVKEQIYLSDTSEILLQKIAKNCCDKLEGKDIFAWINLSKDISLLKTKPIGINYSDLESDKKPNHPLLAKEIDERFVNLDGSIKRNSKNSAEHYEIYNNLVVNNEYNIYYCTIEDARAHSNIISHDKEDLIKNGYLKKYFPFFDGPSDTKIDKKIEMISNQKSLQDHFNEVPVDVRPINLVYENKSSSLLLDISKIFTEFKVNEVFPYLRIQNDNYMDSYVKLYTDIINVKFEVDPIKTLTKDIFIKWNRNIYLQDGFTRPRGLDKINSLSFIIYDPKSTNYMTMILSNNGLIKLYCEKLMRLEKFTNTIMKQFIKKTDELINMINKILVITKIPKIIHSPSRIDMSFMYDISDYHNNMLSKLFQSLHTEFLMISNDDDRIHLLYRCDNYENPIYIPDFITLCKKKSLRDDIIITLCEQRYGLTKAKAREYYDDWLRISLTRPMKLSSELHNISVIIEKVVDRIKVSLLDITSFGQLHECMNTINFIMAVYKERKINKKKDFPPAINNLFKINHTKNIVTSHNKTDKEEAVVSAEEAEEAEEAEDGETKYGEEPVKKRKKGKKGKKVKKSKKVKEESDEIVVKVKKSKKKKGKRKLSSYIKWFSGARKDIIKEHFPNLSGKELLSKVGKKGGELWRNMSDHEKQKYA